MQTTQDKMKIAVGVDKHLYLGPAFGDLGAVTCISPPKISG